MLLKDAHGFMADCGHYTEVVMALQSPIIYGRRPQIGKGEILYSGFWASGDKSFLIEPTDRPAQVNTFTPGKPLGPAVNIYNSSRLRGITSPRLF